MKVVNKRINLRDIDLCVDEGWPLLTMGFAP